MTKSRSEREHAKKRAFERYGLILNREDLMIIADLIRQNKACLIYRSSRRITVWQLSYKSTEVVLVYDKFRHEIVTFLPLKRADKLAERRLRENREKWERRPSVFIQKPFR